MRGLAQARFTARNQHLHWPARLGPYRSKVTAADIRCNDQSVAAEQALRQRGCRLDRIAAPIAAVGLERGGLNSLGLFIRNHRVDRQISHDPTLSAMSKGAAQLLDRLWRHQRPPLRTRRGASCRSETEPDPRSWPTSEGCPLLVLFLQEGSHGLELGTKAAPISGFQALHRPGVVAEKSLAGTISLRSS